ncbi:MAG: UDP-N-acetylmuramoyl-L-alanyl-D-glutamate--2,6-diaminopimelate ligase [Elusimicrobiales bacterium]
MLITELFRGVEAGPLPEGLDVSGIAVDSRDVKPGDVFFAFSGANTDGHLYIAEAVSRGARAVVTGGASGMDGGRLPFIKTPDINAALAACVNAFYKRPSAALEVIGVTGTNGKTTTTYLLESIWNAAGKKSGVTGTINYRIGGEIISGSVNTTPHALTLQKLLALTEQRGARTAIMEVSSHALALKRVDGILFDCAVFTNLAQDHLDFHLTRGDYLAAKRKLFEMLSAPENAKPGRLAVINGDDPAGWSLKTALSPAVKPVFFGLGAARDWRAQDIRAGLDGTEFTLVSPQGRTQARLSIWGIYNILNALAATACAAGRGIPMDAILNGLAALQRVPGRMEAVRAGQDFRVFVDFAHTESALSAVLAALKKQSSGKIYTVFGCGGERDRTKRGPMGVAVCSVCARAFITSDNPRREPPDQIFSDIEAGVKAAGLNNYTVIPDRREAVRQALKSARKGDIVLLAGKGHERCQVLASGPVEYNDYDTALEALK